MLFFGVMAVLPVTVSANELKLTPSVAVQEEYNDNVFFSSTDKRSDFITTLTPALDFSARGARGEGGLSGGINWRHYARVGSDIVDYFSQGRFDYKVVPRLDVSGLAGVTRDSRPDRIDAATGIALNTGSLRQSYHAGGNYLLSEKNTVSLSYGFDREDFELEEVPSTRVHSASAGLSHLLAPETSLEGNFVFSRQLTDVSQVDDYTLMLGVKKKFRQLWSLALDVGGRYTHASFQGGGNATNDDAGWVGNLSFIYTGEKVNGNVTFNHDVSVAAGRTGSLERTGGSVTIGKRFTEKLSGNLFLGYYYNKSNQNQFSLQPIDERTLDLNCVSRYEFTRDLALEASYHYVNVSYREFGTDADQSIAMLRFIWRHPLLL